MRKSIFLLIMITIMAGCDQDTKRMPITNTEQRTEQDQFALQPIGDCRLLEPATGQTVTAPDCN